jgi:hypothetical protein
MGGTTSELTGKEFNEQYEGPFVKLTTIDEIHNGQKIVTGENKDVNPWFPYLTCFPGKIYFIPINQIHMWIAYDGKCMAYIRYVTIENDAKIYVERASRGRIKFGADKLMLSEPRDLRKYILENNIVNKQVMCYYQHAYYYLHVQQNASNYISTPGEFVSTIDKSLELCIKCLKFNIINLDCVPEKHREQCVLRILNEEPKLINTRNMINYFEQLSNPTKELYWRFVNVVYSNNIDNTEYSEEIFKTMYGHVINQLWNELDEKQINIINVQTQLIEINESLELDLYSDMSIKFLTLLVNQLVKRSYEVLDFVPKTYDLKYISENLVKSNWKTIKYIAFPSYRECYYAISQSYEAIGLIEEPKLEFCKFAISQDWRAIKLINNPLEELCEMAIKQDWRAIHLINKNNVTASMWTIAILQSDDALDELIGA